MQNGGPTDFDVVVVGAGVAGCAAAIALRRAGLRVTLLERGAGPQARFCGEFVSGEAWNSLTRLGVATTLDALSPNPIHRLELHPSAGAPLCLPLAAGGFGLTRQMLDAALLGRAIADGAAFFPRMQVNAVSGSPGQGFRVSALADGDRPQVFTARAVIGAQGKRSSVDRALDRPFLAGNSAWVGVRQRYRGVDCGDAVALHLFPGGYCGAVSTESGVTTVALLAGQRALKECGDRPERLIERARACNRGLRERLGDAVEVPGSLMTIGRISFAPKNAVVQGIFMAGDSGGVTAPFLGTGVARALASALACADVVVRWLDGGVDFEQSRQEYEGWWGNGARLRSLSRVASGLLCRPLAGNSAVQLLRWAPSVAAAIYRQSRAPAAAGELRGAVHAPLWAGGRAAGRRQGETVGRASGTGR